MPTAEAGRQALRYSGDLTLHHPDLSQPVRIHCGPAGIEVRIARFLDIWRLLRLRRTIDAVSAPLMRLPIAPPVTIRYRWLKWRHAR
jgi:hypothetical protein